MKPTVVFVDDDVNIREAIKRIFRHEPYRVLAFESAQQCVDALAYTDMHVLVTDLNMPGFNGQTLVNFFKDNKSEVVRIVLSGKLDLETTLELVNRGNVFRCLEKPCPSFLLLGSVREALTYYFNNSHNTERSHTHLGDTSTDAAETTALMAQAVQDIERLERALENDQATRNYSLFSNEK